MSHRVLESIPARVARPSEELVGVGYSPRHASRAEFVEAVLHFYTPASVDEAREMLQRWATLKAAPPAPPPAD